MFINPILLGWPAVGACRNLCPRKLPFAPPVFDRLGRFHEAGSFFVIRAKRNLKAERRYSHKVDRSTGLVCDQTVTLTGFYSHKGFPAPLRRVRFKDPETGKKIRQQGRVRHDEMHAWIRERGVSLRGADLDEAPQAYRRLPDVLAHHAGTIRIEHTLRPFGVVMAGADVVDPFKD